MIGPDEIGDRRQANHTPAVALGLAALLLLIVGFLSYRDFLKTSIEKDLEQQYAEKERQLMNQYGVQPGPGEVAPERQAYRTEAPVVPENDLPGGNRIAPLAGVDPLMERAASDLEIESTLPAPSDPELDAIRNSLDQVREQTVRTEQRYQQITEGVDTLARNSAEQAESASEFSEELPDFLREAVENPPGGDPEVEARLERMREQVRNSPSLAKVTGYDKEWGIVTFNAGANQGVKPDQRFAVRRGSAILGWIKVDDVQENTSIAVLQTKNRNSDTAAKPDVGDDLIDFELF